MMTTLQTLEMALAALSDFDYDKRQEAIVALRQQIALEKMAENERELGIQMQPDEPVAWMMPDGKTVDKWGLQFYGGQTGTPLYTHPQPAADRATELLKRCENEMRYAGWDKFESDNTARNGVYEQVKQYLEKNT